MPENFATRAVRALAAKKLPSEYGRYVAPALATAGAGAGIGYMTGDSEKPGDRLNRALIGGIGGLGAGTVGGHFRQYRIGKPRIHVIGNKVHMTESVGRPDPALKNNLRQTVGSFKGRVPTRQEWEAATHTVGQGEHDPILVSHSGVIQAQPGPAQATAVDFTHLPDIPEIKAASWRQSMLKVAEGIFVKEAAGLMRFGRQIMSSNPAARAAGVARGRSMLPKVLARPNPTDVLAGQSLQMLPIMNNPKNALGIPQIRLTAGEIKPLTHKGELSPEIVGGDAQALERMQRSMRSPTGARSLEGLATAGAGAAL